MPLEVFNFIKDLVATNPPGTDPKSEGDDHVRGVKSTLLKQFEGFTLGKPILMNEDQLNGLLLDRAGIIFDFGGETAPTGSLICSGQELLKVDYPELYNAIGDVWGETDGAVTPDADHFRIPPQDDSGSGSGLFRRGKGDTISLGTHQNDLIKAHTHDVRARTIYDGTGAFDAMTANGAVGASKTQPDGGAETRPKNITVLMCIWTGQ